MSRLLAMHTLIQSCLTLLHSARSSYVVKALEVDKNLPFKMDRLHELVKMEAGSWRRHQEWIHLATREGRGI